MGRRAKEVILSNPTEFDFEVRPRHLVPEGFEDEAMELIDSVLTLFQVDNPRMQFVLQTGEEAYFRFEAEQMVEPAQTDILGRVIKEPTWRRVMVQCVCIPLDTPFQEADLYSLGDKKSFNCWKEIELHYKNAEDPRLKRLVKYP